MVLNVRNTISGRGATGRRLLVVVNQKVICSHRRFLSMMVPRLWQNKLNKYYYYCWYYTWYIISMDFLTDIFRCLFTFEVIRFKYWDLNEKTLSYSFVNFSVRNSLFYHKRSLSSTFDSFTKHTYLTFEYYSIFIKSLKLQFVHFVMWSNPHRLITRINNTSRKRSGDILIGRPRRSFGNIVRCDFKVNI